MFCIQLPQNCKFIDQAFLSVLGIDDGLLEEGFYCEFSVISESFCFVDSGEVALAEFPDWLKHFMEAFLVHSLPQNRSPLLSISIANQYLKLSSCIIIESESYFGGLNLLLNVGIFTSLRQRTSNLFSKDISRQRGSWLVCQMRRQQPTNFNRRLKDLSPARLQGLYREIMAPEIDWAIYWVRRLKGVPELQTYIMVFYNWKMLIR